jgi:cellulose synthase/poly-beta-1,6-N-acetylglucosamine synthase-like glycosyltransferase
MRAWAALALAGLTLLVLPWVVYPALVALVARFRARSPRAPGGSQPLLSVILATREAPAAVLARLQDLVSGAWPSRRLELIVAIDGDPAPYSFDGLLPGVGALRVVAADPPGGKASALNAGVRAASAEFLVFTDTHQRFQPEAISLLHAALEGSRCAAVSGALVLGNPDSSLIGRYWRIERALRAAEARIHSPIGVSGSIYAMRRSLWTPLPPGLILDDLWVPMKLVLGGHRIGFEPNAVAVDRRRTTADQEFSRKVRTLTGNLQLVAWMPAVLLPWRNPVWIQFLCHKLLRLATPYALLAMAAGVLGLLFSRGGTAVWGLLAAVTSLIAIVVAWPGGLGLRLRHALAWGLALQGAVVVATWNGLRGRWDVWRR